MGEEVEPSGLFDESDNKLDILSNCAKEFV